MADKDRLVATSGEDSAYGGTTIHVWNTTKIELRELPESGVHYLTIGTEGTFIVFLHDDAPERIREMLTLLPSRRRAAVHV